jgi:glycosyltransferase involved in cell wall biosynthesis
MSGDRFKDMKVLLYNRKRRKMANFSLEFVFEDVFLRLKDRVDIKSKTAPVLSNGILKRILIFIDAWCSQRNVNHVTGDINFAVLAFRRRSAMVTIPDAGFLRKATGLQRYIFRKLWLDWPVRHAKLVTTISNSARDEILLLTRCKPEKVQVISVAISTSYTFHPKTFNSDCPRILHVGTAENKNLMRLISACEGVACTLIIVGKLSSSVLNHLQSSRVDFENYTNLTAAEMVQRYVDCDLLSFVSTYEGFGMPILEAQATGRAVVTSNLSSMPEVGGDAACYVDPLNVSSIRTGILRIIVDSKFREDLIAKGQENVKRYNPEAIALQYLALYKLFASDDAAT